MAKSGKRSPRSENAGYWLSYSDMLSGLLLMFVLLMLLVLWIFQGSTASLNQELISERKQLIQEQDKAKSQQQTLLEQEKKLDEQKEANEEQQRKNAELQRQIDQVSGLRKALIEDLKVELDRNSIKASIAESGAIKLESDVFFDFNKSVLKPEGKAFLERFMPVYIKVLLQPAYANKVREIIIEGHTDPVGEYMSNLELSQARAFSVASYCLSENFPGLTLEQRDKLRLLLTANGRSESYPVLSNPADPSSIDNERSRRVEFLFRLAEDDLLKEIDNILKGTK